MATTKNATRKSDSKALKSHTMDIKTVPMPNKREARLLARFRKVKPESRAFVEDLLATFLRPKAPRPEELPQTHLPSAEDMTHRELMKFIDDNGTQIVRTLSPQRAREYVRGLFQDIVNAHAVIVENNELARRISSRELPDDISEDYWLPICREAIDHATADAISWHDLLSDALGIMSFSDAAEDEVTPFLRSVPPIKEDPEGSAEDATA